jgi:RNA polymerase sigma factor (sigma-70 family)
MAERISDGVSRQMHQLLDFGAVGAMSDAQLLDRFAAQGGDAAEAAFEMLVIRHGPMVLRVCRTVLQNAHDAEDAFQAVFLVLANRAETVRRDRSAAGWLFGVAQRVATRLKRSAGRRQALNRRAADRLANRDPRAADENQADCEALHDEINRLPERLRAPIVLCYFQGQTYDAAAQQLGTTPVAVRGRLVRARERLRRRLIRRGVAIPAGVLAADAIGCGCAEAGVPATLVQSTVRIALGFAVGETATVLARGVLNSMFFQHLRVALLLVGLSIGSSYWAWRVFASEGAHEPPPQAVAGPSVAPPVKKEISGTIRDSAGRPVADVMIVGTERRREIMFRDGVLDDFVRHNWLYAQSGADGRYQFAGPRMKRLDPPIKEFGLFAYHKLGYARRSADELAKSGELTLEPWGRVHGTARVLGKPVVNVAIRLTLDATDQHSMFYDVYEYETRTDQQGRFVVEHVPTGIAHASTGTSFGKDKGPYGLVSSPRRLIKPGSRSS